MIMTKKPNDSNDRQETYRPPEEDSLLDDHKTPTVVAENQEDVKKIKDSCSLKLENPGNDSSSKSRGWTPMLILASLTTCLGSAVPTGFNLGVMNNAAQVMKDFCNTSAQTHYKIVLTDKEMEVLWPTIVSIFLIGGMVGSMYCGEIADKWGRRTSLMLGNASGVIGAIMFFFTPMSGSVVLFLLGRLMAGVSGGFATSLVPTYMTEVAPLSLRGAVGVLCQLGLTMGVLLGQVAGLSNVLGTPESWHIMLSLFGPMCLLGLIGIWMLPDTPKYLFVLREQRDEALQALSSFRNMNSMLLQSEINELDKELAVKLSSPKWKTLRILLDPTLRLPLILVLLMQTSQQLSGINAVFNYSQLIFEKAGLSISESQYATLGTGVANIIMAIVSVFIMAHFGRRKLMTTSCYLTVFCLLILCFAIEFQNFDSFDSFDFFMPWVGVVFSVLFVLVYGIGMGPIPYFIGSELFDVGPRSQAMALGSLFNWGGNFAVSLTFPLISSLIGAWSFLLYAEAVLFCALFCWFYLPETRGKTTSVIAASVSKGFSSRPTRN